MTDVFFGNSICKGLPANLKFPNLFCAAEGTQINNLAVGGSTVQMQLPAILGYVSNPNNRVFMMLGTNDGIYHGWTPDAIVLFSQGMDAGAFYLTHRTYEAIGKRWSFTGTWQPEASQGAQYGIGKVATAVGAKASTSFNGDGFSLGYIVSTDNLGMFSVKVDGTFFTLVSCRPPYPISAYAGYYQLARISGSGFGPGEHTLDVVVETAGNIFVEWISNNEQTRAPVTVITLPYTTRGNGDDDRVAAYNTKIEALASPWVNVFSLDDVIDPLVDMFPSDFHPNDRGAFKIAAGLSDFKRMQGGISL